MNIDKTAAPHAAPTVSARPPESTFAFFAYCLFALCLPSALLVSPPALAQNKNNTPPAHTEIVEKKDDLKDIRGQIQTLRKEISSTEGKRANVADQLKEVEQEISTTQRGLHNLSAQRSRLEDELKSIGTQSHDLEARLAKQQAQLEKLIYRQYLQSNPDSLRLLLNGENPNQMARDLHYLSTIGRARSELLQEISASLQQKNALTEKTRERADELTSVEARQKEQHGKLLSQREQRKEVLEKISTKISAQRREIGNLQRDEKQLSQLINQLAKAIAKKPAPRKEPPPPPQRKLAQEKTPQKEKTPPTNEPQTQEKNTAPEISNENTPQPSASGNFSRLKGSLRLPTRGNVSNRFGASRQEGSSWKGLFIRASTGNDVKAIAGGRVVFADWMRGFGNLLIIDHGNSFLSIYGNNDALLKQTGDEVRGGDTVAAVGNSGGNPESGLYFELRHQGKPIDPMPWVSLK